VRWNFRQAQSEQVQALADGISSVAFLPKNHSARLTLARLLLLRGINTAELALSFLSPSINQLHSPYLMTGMKAAVERLDAAIERKEGILVYGDYDVDGTTAVVILKTAIEL
jgi:single-stranded-DNA-specific exonuclease